MKTPRLVTFVSQPKSGTHLLMRLLERSGLGVFTRHHVPEIIRKHGRVDLCLVRHPFDVAVSWACAFELKRPETDPAEIARAMPRAIRAVENGALGYLGWTEGVRASAEAAKHVVRYEDLVAAPTAAMAEVGVDVSRGAEILADEIKRMPTDEAWSTHCFRRGRPGEWRNVVRARPDVGPMLEAALGEAALDWGYTTTTKVNL